MNNKFLYVILIILICILCVEGYILFNGNFSSENKIDNTNYNDNQNNKLKDGVKLISTKKENDNIIQEYEIVLNGHKTIMPITYSLIIYEDAISDLEEPFYCLRGDYYSDCTIENKKELFNEEYINSNFNEKNFELVKGEDNKNYLAIYNLNYGGLFAASKLESLYLLNDNLEVVKPNIEDLQGYNDSFIVYTDTQDYESSNTWYSDKLNFCKSDSCQIRTKIENNYIYSLIFVSDQTCSLGTLEERKYSINNNDFTYEVINSYPVTNANGSC